MPPSPTPSKRRRLDAAGTPQSAVSALAARRRLTASAEVRASTPSTSEETAGGPASSRNPFGPLQASRPKQKREPGTATAPGQASTAGQVLNDPGPTTETQTESSALGAAQPRVVTYSSFSRTKNNYRVKADGVVELRLEDSERFLLLGNFGIRVLSGQVTVAGAALQPSEAIHWVHAPHCHAVPVLRTAEKTRLALHNDAEAENLRKLGRLSPLFRSIWNEPPVDVGETWPRQPSTFQFLGTPEDAPQGRIVQELVSPPKWNKKLASLVESASRRKPFVAVICGPKSAGKSTFSKLLTNRLLTSANAEPAATSVAVLDLDPGQPEYAPPGTLSLVHVTRPNLGVPFTHPSLDDEAYRVVRCHSLASVNLASAGELHLECAMDLYDCHRRTLHNCPLLINTPGWVLGLGLELLTQIITKIRPAEVIYMSEEGPAETVEGLRGAIKNTFTTLPSQPSEFKSRTAAHFREMQTMSYFHSSQRNGPGAKSRLSWTPSALSSIRPFVVRYSGPHSGILGILRYEYQLPPDLIAEAINGMVLAMVEIEEPRAFRELVKDNASGFTDTDGEVACRPLVLRSPEGIPYIPNPDDLALDPRHSRTIGLALIRGIDTASKSLQIVTPTPLEKIMDAKSRGSNIVLIHGKFDPPTWSYTEHLYEQAGQENESEDELQVTDEDTSDDNDSGANSDPFPDADDGDTVVPWVEVLRGNQKRPVGSRVWRVRRDLGRNAGGE